MSAYICDQSIFATLGAFAALTVDNMPAQAAADCLAAENVRSVNYRYNENTPAAPVDLATAKASPSKSELLEMISEYCYQACECADYSETAAALLIKRLRSNAVAYVPNDTTTHDPTTYIGAALYNEQRGVRGYVVDVVTLSKNVKSGVFTPGGFEEYSNTRLTIAWLPTYDREEIIISGQAVNTCKKELFSRHNWPSITPAQAAALYEEANKETRDRVEKEKAAREKREAEKMAFSEQIAALMVGDEKGVIIAELQENECDAMTDYFASTTAKTVILGFSKTGRNNFGEMRKAIAAADLSDLPGLAALANAENGEERRENYSMGAGYYITSGGSYHGWHVRKVKAYAGFLRPQDVPAGDIRLPSNNPPGHAGKKEAEKSAQNEQQAGAVEVRKNEEKNGIELVFNEKPAREILDAIKAAGYRWHRSGGYWYAKASAKAKQAAEKIAGYSLGAIA